VELQKDYDCLYGVVNYHAMTMPFKKDELIPSTWEVVFNLIACGIESGNIFIQSLIPEHTELAWIFNCMCSYGELSRMTQFKDKSQFVRDSSRDAFISSGLFTYPVLQAADILIYRADYVPVGKDQEQHLELTRSIAQRFNFVAGKEYFVLPETLFSDTPKIMSTAEPTRKMSASQGEKHNINIFSDPALIRKKIKSAVTDSGAGGMPMSPGVENLFVLLKASGSEDHYRNLLHMYQANGLSYGELKKIVAEELVRLTNPIRERKREILSDKRAYKMRIKDSSSEIRKKAQRTLSEVKELVGLVK
jgi:tryptophanyl-tRNA synthetase